MFNYKNIKNNMEEFDDYIVPSDDGNLDGSTSKINVSYKFCYMFNSYEEYINCWWEYQRPKGDITSYLYENFEDYRFKESVTSYKTNNIQSTIKDYNKFKRIMKDLDRNTFHKEQIPKYLTKDYQEALHDYFKVILACVVERHEGYIIKICVEGTVQSKYSYLLENYKMMSKKLVDRFIPMTKYILKDKGEMYSQYRNDSHETEEETIHMEIYELGNSFSMEQNKMALIEEMLNEVNARNYIIISLQNIIRDLINETFFVAEKYRVIIHSATEITIYFEEESDVQPIKYINYSDYRKKDISNSIIKGLEKVREVFATYPTLEFVEIVKYKEESEMKRFYKLHDIGNNQYLGKNPDGEDKYLLIENNKLFAHVLSNPMINMDGSEDFFYKNTELDEMIKETLKQEKFDFHVTYIPLYTIVIEKRTTQTGKESVVTVKNTEEDFHLYCCG